VIKNLLMDLGNVTLSFDPKAMVSPWVESEADRDQILRAVFLHPDWSRGDGGGITEAELRENARERLPERLHEALDNVLLHWPEYLTALPGAREFMLDMKARGLKLYALSNAPLRYQEFRKDLPLVDLFDGEVISALIGRSKPGAEFFRYALDTYSLNPEECLFADDLEPNVLGARAAGIEACVFDGDYGALTALIEQKNS
jgi:putative hydrolase of the HAD superfamily